MIVKGRSLELYFVDGRPDGMLTAEVFNWTGHVLRTPRTQLADALKRREAGYSGVYILLGEVEGHSTAYIGEAEELRTRIRSHASQKEWWESAVLITSAADNLHKAHIKYLESRLVEIATNTSVIKLENGNAPTRSSLSEAATANMESFLETLQIVLPAIRVDMFLDKKRSVKNYTESSIVSYPEIILNTPKHSIVARAVIQNGEIVVRTGSDARARWAGTKDSKAHYFNLFDELVATGVLTNNGKNNVFSSDYAFSSPSAAASVINGRSSNGRRSWKLAETGMSLGEWENKQLEDS